ncbi:hypothetical protein MTBBW1_2500003 [Desulfamplus magnetovallimortis]|uniref:Uncharacterized protein n=1 Tax=Desulfamplus magnetovallimortis TaxID=1246637 RepID=A0A1W1HEC9_9BACT|nr:hypothetical protein [Desulfamplus magnetovallimortis]SLM30854.1 hypothetical protein MTBBW1_2500003 [Desulfamplus magnetovallimortis]
MNSHHIRHGRQLGAKARLARKVTEGKYPELKKELLCFKERSSGNWCPEDEQLASTISKSDALKIILSLSDFDIETLTLLGIMPDLKKEEI